MAPLIHFITGNANKLREVKAILEPSIEIRSQSLDLEEIQGTIEEVANSKCRRAADLVWPSSSDFIRKKRKTRRMLTWQTSLRSTVPCL
jgi:hypothetical protein